MLLETMEFGHYRALKNFFTSIGAYHLVPAALCLARFASYAFVFLL